MECISAYKATGIMIIITELIAIKNAPQQCIKIIAEIAVNSRVVARFNFLVI